MKRKAFTLVELLVVVAVIFIIAAIVAAVADKHFGNKKQITAEVLEKWTDLDGDGDRIYRVRTRTESGEIETWESRSVHEQLKTGQWYRFEATGVHLRTVQFVPSEPIKPSATNK